MRQVFLWFITPLRWLLLLLWRWLLLPLYSLLKKSGYRLSKLYENRQNILRWLSRYLPYSLIIIILLLTAWQSLHAQNVAPENFARDTLIFSLTNSGEDFHENEEVTEGPLSDSQLTPPQSFLRNEALSEEDVILDEPPVSKPDLAMLTPDESSLQAVDTGGATPEPSQTREIIEYTVQSGDVLSTIAAQFNISTDTLLWANDLTAYSIIRPGQKLKIMPTSGLLYSVKSGDTLEKIATTYQSDINKIIEFNKLASANDIRAGEDLILPGGIKPATYRPVSKPVTNVFSSQPTANDPATDAGGRFLWPTTSRRITQYFSWRHTGLDIGNGVGQPIYAAESGKVEAAGWNNGGYGYYIIINHGGGLKTLYGHCSKLYVKKGETVSRGDIIAAIGSTGRSTGPHIHFEVRSNDKKVNPLEYIK
ncbi:MAG: peptidoglycan DD-metalloendopeptidase family protein [Candidatus Komeilibacteria bacterium]